MKTQHTAPSYIESTVLAQNPEFVITREQFLTFRDAYKELAHRKQVTAKDIVLYNVVRGLPNDRGFTSITNPVKIANGLQKDHGFKDALDSARFYASRRTSELSKRFNNFTNDEGFVKISLKLSK